MRPPPVVTGISPAEGPPGTKVIIRGENLGINAKDVTGLSICGANCLLSADYKSAGKIIARTGQAKPGKGDVIVTTRSGGVGTSTVQFKSVMVVPDPLKESAVWLEEVDPEELRARSGSARPVSPQINASQDPLGTGTDVFGYKLTEEQLEDFYPEGSGNILSDNFHPGWFLLEKHSDTEFITLRGGLKYLRHEESRRAEDPLVFVKENVATFLDAVDTLRNVQHDMLRDESNCDGGSIVEKLESFVQGASKNAEGLFQDVLGRKDDADRTRNALNVLQRFRFLFSLPQCIERNIQLGEYEMVISDYGRAKSLFAGTDIKIFKRVLQEVEAKIEGFRRYLKVKLSDLPSPLEDQKRLIRYLVDLDYQGDPAWECLANQKDWLLKLLMSSQEDHKSKDSVPLLQVDSAKVDLDIRTSRSALSLASYRGESLGILGVSSPPNKTSSVECSMKGVSAVPQRVLFVEELSELLIEGLPDLWKLGQAYFNGDLAADSSSGSSKQLNATEQKRKTFEDMIYDVASLYADLIKAAFFPSSHAVLSISSNEKQSSSWQSPADGVGAWLPSCVRHVRSCMESLQKLSLPPQALERIKKLVGDLRLLCAKEVFKEAIEDIKSLHCNELWSLESQEGVGRITSLPLMFENIVMETLHTLREMVTHGAETERRKNIQLKTSAVDLFKDMFEAFIECLQHLAFQPDQESDKVSLSGPQESSSIGSQDNLERSSLSTMEDSTPVIDERLLIVLNNCRYVRNNVLSKLVDCFRSNDYPVSDKLKKDLTSELNDLEGKIFDAYIEQKADPLIAYVEPGMTICDFKWHNCLPPKDVRSYVKEVLMNLVTVHAQVFAVSEELLTQVLSRLTDMLADEFCRLVSAVKTFTSAGAVTAHLEARAIQEALAAYLTQHSREMFQATFSKVPAITKDSDKRLIEALMTTFKRRMRFQLQCFQVDMEEL